MATTDARTAVVLTALPVEFQAVREHLVEVEERFHPAGTVFYVGNIPGSRRRVALVEVGPGDRDAAVVAERSISFLHPELLAFVGVAGGLMSDIGLGNVVVPPHVYAYHGGLEDDEGFHARPRTWASSHTLLQFARHVARGDTWWKSLPAVSERVEVHFRPIAAGHVVVNSRESATARLIRRHYNDTAAIEMESSGLANASQLNESRPFIVIRGISDAADGNKYVTDRAGWQLRAARHAAAFAVALLSELPPMATSHGAPAGPVVLPVDVAPVPPNAWEGGADVQVGDHKYLLVDDNLAERTAADGTVVRQARAMRIMSRPVHVWLRQVRARSNRTELDALVAEQELLAALPGVRGLPTPVQFHHDAHTATLAYRWPTSRSTGAPCDTLDGLISGGVALDRWHVRRLLTGMAGLCDTLATLHDRRLAHRALTPAGLIEFDGTLVLRDLGLAARPREAGEMLSSYQAPEQSRRSTHQPGPGTDVYRLGAVTYHVVTGHLPNPVHPLPLIHFRPDLPERCVAAVDTALRAEPAARPGIRSLGEAFRAAARELG